MLNIHSHKHLLNAYSVPRTLLGTKDMMLRKTLDSYSLGSYILDGQEKVLAGYNVEELSVKDGF